MGQATVGLIVPAGAPAAEGDTTNEPDIAAVNRCAAQNRTTLVLGGFVGRCGEGKNKSKSSGRGARSTLSKAKIATVVESHPHVAKGRDVRMGHPTVGIRLRQSKSVSP